VRLHATLRRRLDRLEGQHKQRRVPRTVAHIYGKERESVIGFQGEKAGTLVQVWRAAGEAVNACEARAWELVSSASLFALHGPEIEPDSTVPAPAPIASPEPAPVDPWPLAGIGVRATEERLWAMGALPVPPERLI
jgi:hypothetical protein